MVDSRALNGEITLASRPVHSKNSPGHPVKVPSRFGKSRKIGETCNLSIVLKQKINEKFQKIATRAAPRRQNAYKPLRPP